MTAQTIFRGLPSPMMAGRYHSLVIDAASVPSTLEVSAKTGDGVIMGVRDRQNAVEGVQFHPESIMTPEGHNILSNFLRCRYNITYVIVIARRSVAISITEMLRDCFASSAEDGRME